jgi:hypothetical protein
MEAENVNDDIDSLCRGIPRFLGLQGFGPNLFWLDLQVILQSSAIRQIFQAYLLT